MIKDDINRHVARKLILLYSLGVPRRGKVARRGPCYLTRTRVSCNPCGRNGWVLRCCCLWWSPTLPADSCPWSCKTDLGICHDCLAILDTEHSNVKLPFTSFLIPFPVLPRAFRPSWGNSLNFIYWESRRGSEEGCQKDHFWLSCF